MGIHDDYGKSLLRRAGGSRYDTSGTNSFSFGLDAGEARLDGVIAEDIVVEIESRTDKQIRGALLDLILHPYPKKLMLLIPMHMNSVERTRRQCEAVLARFDVLHRIVVLQGTGSEPMLECDTELVRVAIEELDRV